MVQDNNHSNGDGNDLFTSSSPQKNVISFLQRNKDSAPPQPPMINLPPVSKALIILMIAVHITIQLSGLIEHTWSKEMTLLGAFTPAAWSGGLPFSWWTPLTLLSFTFIHGGWMHLGINLLMLAAFGTGVERWLGAKPYLLIFFLGSVGAALLQFAAAPDSPLAVIGASGAVSSLFGALVLMLKEQRALGNPRNSMVPFIVTWIAVTVLFGMMGAPDGSPIAWLAHLGGFFTGLAITWKLRRAGR